MNNLTTPSILLAAFLVLTLAKSSQGGSQYIILDIFVIKFIHIIIFLFCSDNSTDPITTEVPTENSVAALVPALSMVASAILVRLFQ